DEHLMKQEIERYESMIPVFEAEAKRQGEPDPKTAVANWIKYCKDFYLSFRRLQMWKAWNRLSATERIQAAGYQHTEHYNNPGEDSHCWEGCKYWHGITINDGKEMEDYFEQNERDMIGTLWLYYFHRKVIPARDYANSTKTTLPSNIIIW
ncbi:MAG: hypothetical protein WBQ25_19930, partial [Nitrososphaeraceae archaeon]